MEANIMDEILKSFPDLEDGWKEMEEKKNIEPAEREMLSLKYRERLEREMLKENLPEPEFTKTKRAESDLKVMEENKAPEKIYLVPFGKPIRQPLPQEGSDADTIWSSRPYANSNAGNIEYTRTDAFIEKALDYIENNIYDHYDGDNEYGICGGYVKKEEFIKNFQNYMKGE